MGRFIKYIGSPCSAMRKAQNQQNQNGSSVYVPQVGDIIVKNSITNETKVLPYSEWLQLEDSWDIQGIYGVTTYEEENAENGYYVIMSNGVTLIIAPEDFNKVSNNWEQVDTIVVVDPYNGYTYVDLGLPSGTKWATMNVGASSETNYGNYYQYGKGASQYSETYQDETYQGTENHLSLEYDTAAQVMGGSWHMPTQEQLNELTANTTYEWTTINGVNGGKFTSQNGNYVFFAATGYWYNGSQHDVGSYGRYWGSSLRDSSTAYYLYFDDGIKGVQGSNRKSGYSVRGVVG